MRGGQVDSITTVECFSMQVVMMIGLGYSAERACDKLFSVYGPGLSVLRQ